MKHNEYITPEIEVMALENIDILTSSGDFVFLPTDEFREM